MAAFGLLLPCGKMTRWGGCCTGYHDGQKGSFAEIEAGEADARTTSGSGSCVQIMKMGAVPARDHKS